MSLAGERFELFFLRFSLRSVKAKNEETASWGKGEEWETNLCKSREFLSKN